VGRLVILDVEGNVAVVDPDGSNLETITDDAGIESLYSQPLWSPDASMLAWGRATESGFSIVLHDLELEESRSVATGNHPFYISWSPDGSRLGVLHNGDGGIDFNLVDVEGTTIRRIDTGAPYYFSWRPDGGLLVTHVGPDTMETIDPADGARTPGQPTGPAYLAPQWTVAGIFHVFDGSLVLGDEAGGATPVASVDGAVFFVASPDGSKVALQTTGPGDDAFEVGLSEIPVVASDAVVVLDTTTGTIETVTEEQALGFFWSPDGTSLLTLVVGEETLDPVVWRDGKTSRYDGYLPPAAMLQDTFPFFPQYAQSVAFWAPDSSAFTYAGEVDGEPGIWVQQLDADAPIKAADGRWVVWSS
jgi:TolB protein